MADKPKVGKPEQGHSGEKTRWSIEVTTPEGTFTPPPLSPEAYQRHLDFLHSNPPDGWADLMPSRGATFEVNTMPETPDVHRLMKHWSDLIQNPEGQPDCPEALEPRDIGDISPALRAAFIRAGSTPEQVDNMCIYPKDVGVPYRTESGEMCQDVKVSWKPGYVDIKAVVSGSD